MSYAQFLDEMTRGPQQGVFSFMRDHTFRAPEELDDHTHCHPLERFASHYPEHREDEARDLDPNPLYARDPVFDNPPDNMEPMPADLTGREVMDFHDLYKLGGRVIGRHDAVVDLPWFFTAQFIGKRLRCTVAEAKALSDCWQALDFTEPMVTAAIAEITDVPAAIALYQGLAAEMQTASDLQELPPLELADGKLEDYLQFLRTRHQALCKARYQAGSPATDADVVADRRKLQRWESYAVSSRHRPNYRDVDYAQRSYPADDDAMEHRPDGFAHTPVDIGSNEFNPEWLLLLQEGVPSAAMIAYKLSCSLAKAGDIRDALILQDFDEAKGLVEQHHVDDDEDDILDDHDGDQKDEDVSGFVSEGWHIMDQKDDPPEGIWPWLEAQPAQVKVLFRQVERATSLADLKKLGQKVYALEWTSQQRGAFWAVWKVRRQALLSHTMNHIARVRKAVCRMEAAKTGEVPAIGSKLFNLSKVSPDFYSPEGWAIVWAKYRQVKAAKV